MELADVAQLAVHLICNQKVAGSTPASLIEIFSHMTHWRDKVMR